MKKEQELTKIFSEMETAGIDMNDCGLYDFKHVDPNSKITLEQSMRILSSGEKTTKNQKRP